VKPSESYVYTPRVSFKRVSEKVGNAAGIVVYVLLGLTFFYGALLVYYSPVAPLGRKDAGLVNLMPTMATVESIDYPREGLLECLGRGRHGHGNSKLDATFRFISDDGKLIKVRKTICEYDIPGWGAPVFKRESIHVGEEILVWYDPTDPSKISWPTRFSSRQLFSGLKIMGSTVVFTLVLATCTTAFGALSRRLRQSRWLVLLRTVLRPVTHRRARLTHTSVDGHVDYYHDLAVLLPLVKDDLVARQKFLDILQTIDPTDPRTIKYRKKFTTQLFK